MHSQIRTALAGKRFVILGFGVSGIATYEFLKQLEVQILVSDTRSLDSLDRAVQELLGDSSASRIFEFGMPHSDRCFEADYLLISPGINPKDELIQKAKAQGVQVLTEVEFAMQFMQNTVCITGTNGKSTVSAWTAHVLEVEACGNIGLPCLKALSRVAAETGGSQQKPFVVEVSSYMLTHSLALKPNIAVITNITPDHISWHGSWEAYVESKFKITQHQTVSDWLILPDEKLFREIETQAQVLWIQVDPANPVIEYPNCAFVDEAGYLIVRLKGQVQEICHKDQIRLPGDHNLLNALFVASIALIQGVPLEQLTNRLLSFKALEHRLEFVGDYRLELDEGFMDYSFFNDSKSTNPESSIVALKAFPGQSVIWLAGGRDKMTDLSELMGNVAERVSSVILYGEARQRFAKALRDEGFQGSMNLVENLTEALILALSGDELDLPVVNEVVVLFSPACASFDQFANFEERGKHFKKLVSELSKLSLSI